MYQSLFTQYTTNLDADIDWATDLSLPDDVHSRTSDRWVTLSLVRGAATHFGLDWMLDDDSAELDSESAELATSSGGLTRAVKFSAEGVVQVGAVRRAEGITLHAYTAAASRYRANKWKSFADNVRRNRAHYAADAEQIIAKKRNPRSINGNRVVIHHRMPIAHGGDPIKVSNLEFMEQTIHHWVHAGPGN